MSDHPIPVATHSGEFKLGNLVVHVHVLDDGRRIIDCDDLDAIFAAMTGATIEEVVAFSNACKGGAP